MKESAIASVRVTTVRALVLSALVWSALLLSSALVHARPGGGERYAAPPSYTPSPSPPSYAPNPSPPSYSPRPSPPSYSPSPSPPSYSPRALPDTPVPGYVPREGDFAEWEHHREARRAQDEHDASILLKWTFGTLAAGVLIIWLMVWLKRREDWTMGAIEADALTFAPPVNSAPPRGTERREPAVPPPDDPRGALVALVTKRDPDFSIVLFEDFLYSLFVAFHETRGGSLRHDVAPYLEAEALKLLEGGRKDDVTSVLVGAMSIENVTHVKGRVAVQVVFEANYEEVDNGQRQAFYTRETWTLQRDDGAKSRPPERTALDECPNCGGELADMDGNVCAYCHEALTPGRFDWALTTLDASRETRPPMLIGQVVEVGHELPTVVAAGAQERLARLADRDPNFSWPVFHMRVYAIFEALHAGWVARDWRRVRPFLSDQLFGSQLYWIEEYRQQRLVNRTDGSRIVDIHMANANSDAVFDAITVRVFATGKDYTMTESGRLVSGSKTFDRRYSEYWTLIRGRDVVGSSPQATTCPNCAAPIDVNMAGACEHCDAKITRGDFDWVLSRIEQDESYR